MNAKEFVDYLNCLLAIDPSWVSSLVKRRERCNTAIAFHKTVQVAGKGNWSEPYQAGMLGLLNGFFGQNGQTIWACFDDETGELMRFELKE